MPPAADRRSPLAFVVLASLSEQPLHAYALYQLLQERGKLEVVSVPSRSSLYPVLDRLQRSGLIGVHATERDGGRPERTVYAITPLGSSTVREWLLSYLSSGSDERPGFTLGLSFVMLATPDDVAGALLRRRDALAGEQERIRDDIARGSAMQLPPLFSLDEHYRAQVLDVDLAAVDDLLSRLESGELSWDHAWIRDVAARMAAVQGVDES